MPLKKQATKGSMWISITRTGMNVIDFAVYAYLARILTLEEFGLVGFCFLFIEFANTLVNAGINQNLVQRKTWDDGYAASTMTFVSGMGLVVAACLVFIGAPIAHYSYSTVAAYVVASLAPITIIMSLQVVVTGKLLREFKNKQMGTAKFIATVFSGILIIVLAEMGYGLWSLVIGKLVNAVLEFALLTYVSGFKPRFHFDREDNKELISFCLPLLWMTIMTFFHRKASNMFTGIVLGPASFALLAAAKKGELVINQITMSSINSMVVPSFSRAKESANIGDLYIKMVAITATLVLPIFMGLAAIADPFVVVAFGDKFAPSAIYMTISAFIMFPSVVAWFLPNLLISRAKTKEAFKLTLISVLSNILVAGATIWFGVTVMLTALVITNFLILPLRFSIVARHIDIDIKKLIKTLVPPFVCALGLFLCVSGSKTYLDDFIANDIVLLMVLIVIGGISYPLLAFILFYKNTKEQVNEINDMFFGRKKLKS
ncbi:oligosaccharide flippase family protein [Paraglaciecola polaris]|uniref:Probable polysaccharide transport protein n=1 Tax=Paraglaciecola polaris LMG 21857 TaxID=1129793 RepID=K6Z7U5_9ALTE|nr:oligosaccharide flippase family protein [Paraglaciecola polaris]GAC32251.1 probable polysaccharide transport protein [Paraglaciecola polaris LMG 21857]